jgi:hypothetical protein
MAAAEIEHTIRAAFGLREAADVLVSTTSVEERHSTSRDANTILIDPAQIPRAVRARPSCTSCAGASVAARARPLAYLLHFGPLTSAGERGAAHALEGASSEYCAARGGFADRDEGDL